MRNEKPKTLRKIPHLAFRIPHFDGSFSLDNSEGQVYFSVELTGLACHFIFNCGPTDLTALAILAAS